MNTRVIIVLSILVVALQCSKQIVIKQVSKHLNENGRVIEKVYEKPYSQTELVPGLDWEGEPTMSWESVDYPAKYGVVFTCDHGDTFTIKGSTARYKDLYEKLFADQKTVISYKEIHKLVYSKPDRYGRRELIAKALLEYDFIDAGLE